MIMRQGKSIPEEIRGRLKGTGKDEFRREEKDVVVDLADSNDRVSDLKGTWFNLACVLDLGRPRKPRILYHLRLARCLPRVGEETSQDGSACDISLYPFVMLHRPKILLTR